MTVNNIIKSMNKNDTITEVRAAVPSNETKRTVEGYYYVAPGSSVTLVGLWEPGRYWWMGGDTPDGGTCQVVSGKFGGTGDSKTFTALARCIGGYLFVQGLHSVLKSCGDSIAEVRPIKGRQLEPKYSYGITKMFHTPGSVAVVDGDIRMFDSYGTFSVVDSKVGGCRLYGHVSVSCDASEPDKTAQPVQPGEVAKGYKEFVNRLRHSEGAVGHECGHACEGPLAGSVEAGKVLSAEIVHLATTKAKEPPCPKVEPHDGLQGYIKVLFRGCLWETDTGKPLPEHYGPNCYVLVPEDGRTVIGGDEFIQDIVHIVNAWDAPHSLRSYKRAEVSAVTATDRMGRERVMPCDEDGNALFYTVQFKDVRWIKDGKDYGGQADLEVRIPKTGPSLEIDGRAAGSVIGEAVLKAEEGRDAAMYYRNVYFVC